MSAGEPTGDRAEDDQSDGGSVLDEGRSRSSRLLWGLDRFTGLPLTAFSVLAAGVAWVAVSAAFRFPSGWERIFQTPAGRGR